MTDHLLISYSHRDEEYVMSLVRRMREELGLEVWYYIEQEVGTPFLREIKQRIEQARAVVVILSRHSADSEFVMNEVLHAKKTRQLILPLLIEDCEGAVTIILNHINWLDCRGGRDPVTSIAEALDIFVPPSGRYPYPLALLQAVGPNREYITPLWFELEVPRHIIPGTNAIDVQLCTIGRLGKNEISIAQPFVTRMHHAIISARVSTERVDFLIRDNHSKNGIFVNGERIFDTHVLHEHDRLGLGNPEAMLSFVLVPDTCQPGALP